VWSLNNPYISRATNFIVALCLLQTRERKVFTVFPLEPGCASTRVAYLHAAGHSPGLKTEYNPPLSRHAQGARRCFRPPFTTSWPLGAASCGMLSGPAQPPFPLSDPAPPRPPGSHATARAPLNRWQVSRPARMAPRVPTTRLLPPPRLPGDPMRCPRPSDARVQAPPRGPAARMQAGPPAMAAGLTDPVWPRRAGRLDRVPPWPQAHAG
jgi:hypothetical protein